jgi:hypothetical protein
MFGGRRRAAGAAGKATDAIFQKRASGMHGLLHIARVGKGRQRRILIRHCDGERNQNGRAPAGRPQLHGWNNMMTHGEWSRE